MHVSFMDNLTLQVAYDFEPLFPSGMSNDSSYNIVKEDRSISRTDIKEGIRCVSCVTVKDALAQSESLVELLKNNLCKLKEKAANTNQIIEMYANVQAANKKLSGDLYVVQTENVSLLERIALLESHAHDAEQDIGPTVMDVQCLSPPAFDTDTSMLDQLKQKVAHLQAYNLRLQSELNSLSGQRFSFEKAQKDMEKMKREMTIRDLTIKALTERFKDTKAQLEEMKNKSGILEPILCMPSLIAKDPEQGASYVHATTQNSESSSQSRISDGMVELARLKRNREELIALVDEYKVKCSSYTEELNEIETRKALEITELEDELSSLHHTHKLLQQEHSALQEAYQASLRDADEIKQTHGLAVLPLKAASVIEDSILSPCLMHQYREGAGCFSLPTTPSPSPVKRPPDEEGITSQLHPLEEAVDSLAIATPTKRLKSIKRDGITSTASPLLSLPVSRRSSLRLALQTSQSLEIGPADA